jgi:hypothetical protein
MKAWVYRDHNVSPLVYIPHRQNHYKPKCRPDDGKFHLALNFEEINFIESLSQLTTRNFQTLLRKTVLGVVILKTFLFQLFRNVFKLLPINSNDMKIRLKISFYPNRS